MLLDHTHPPSPKNKILVRKKEERKNFIMEATKWSHTINPFIHRFLHGGIHSKEIVQGPWFLLHHQCWALTGMLSGHLIAALLHGDPAALGLQH